MELLAKLAEKVGFDLDLINDSGVQWQFFKALDRHGKARMFLATIQDLKANGKSLEEVQALVAQQWPNLPDTQQGFDAGLFE